MRQETLLRFEGHVGAEEAEGHQEPCSPAGCACSIRCHRLSAGAESILAKQRLHSATDFITDSADFLYLQTLRIAERPVITTKTRHIRTFVATAHCDKQLGITSQF